MGCQSSTPDRTSPAEERSKRVGAKQAVDADADLRMVGKMVTQLDAIWASLDSRQPLGLARPVQVNSGSFGEHDQVSLQYDFDEMKILGIFTATHSVNGEKLVKKYGQLVISYMMSCIRANKLKSKKRVISSSFIQADEYYERVIVPGLPGEAACTVAVIDGTGINLLFDQVQYAALILQFDPSNLKWLTKACSTELETESHKRTSADKYLVICPQSVATHLTELKDTFGEHADNADLPRALMNDLRIDHQNKNVDFEISPVVNEVAFFNIFLNE